MTRNKKTRAEAPVEALDPEGETGEPSEGERWARISGGLGVGWFVGQEVFAALGLMATVGRAARVGDAGLESGIAMRLIAVADVSPIDVGAKVFAANGAGRLALDIDCELFPAELSIDHVSKVTRRCFTAQCKSIALDLIHSKVKGFKFHESDYIHRLVSINHLMVNIFSPDGVAK